jgi:hypothetical protein
MKSGIEIVELWEKLRKVKLDCGDKQLIVEFIEAGLKEAYEAGQQKEWDYQHDK